MLQTNKNRLKLIQDDANKYVIQLRPKWLDTE